MTNMKIICMGTAGWMPTSTRQTMCYVLDTLRELIIFDLGTGICRFSSIIARNIVEKHQRIVILLSHYHLDHIAGLLYLPRFFSGKELVIAGPGVEYYGASVREILDKLSSPPYSATKLSRYPMDISFQDLLPKQNKIQDLEVMVQVQKHPNPSFGYRVNNVCYITDTPCTDSTIGFSEACDVLMHEAMLDNEEYEGAKKNDGEIIHSYCDGVAEISKKAKVKNLIFTHVNPTYTENRLYKMAMKAKSIFPNSILAKDLYKFTIDG